MQVALQRHIDLAVVTGQLRQTGGLKRRAKQSPGYTWTMTEKGWMLTKVHMRTQNTAAGATYCFNHDITCLCRFSEPLL